MASGDQILKQFTASRNLPVAFVYPAAATPTVIAAALSLGVNPLRIIKSLVFIARERPLLVIAAGEARISQKLLKEAVNVSRRQLRMATPAEALAITGYEVGAMPPFGHKAELETLMDSRTVETFRATGASVFGGGGTKSAMIEMDLKTLLEVARARLLPLTDPLPAVEGDTNA